MTDVQGECIVQSSACVCLVFVVRNIVVTGDSFHLRAKVWALVACALANDTQIAVPFQAACSKVLVVVRTIWLHVVFVLGCGTPQNG